MGRSGEKWHLVVESGRSFMFMGAYSHTIDAKGRLIIPAKFREGLGERFVVSKGFDGCLQAYDPESWKDIARFFLGGAVEAEIDKQGRILIPATLRQYAGLEKDVTLVGSGSKVEIWDSAKWNKAEPESIEDLAENLSALGFSL